ncbi:MAG: hypothetical protein KAI74_07020, partial [Kiritimatiellae bacterium]|nr:hypothetical protein [Kiritimatiellia bacterium]
KKVHTGTHEETTQTGDRTTVSYETYAQDHEVIEKQQITRTQTFQHDVYSFYDTPYLGYDVEVGTKVPYIDKYFETRIFAGYYDFQPVWDGNVESTGDINGFKGRLEVRALKGLYLDATVYEDDKLMGSQWTAGARLMLSFDLALIGEGRNPFSSTAADQGISKRQALRNRIVENVIRDPHIQLRQQGQQTTSSSSSSSTKTSYRTVLDDVIFVNNSNAADTQQDGSSDHPFAAISLGLAVTKATLYDTIYVYAGNTPYRENLYIDHTVNLIGAGSKLGRGAGMGGTAPRIIGSAMTPGVDGNQISPNTSEPLPIGVVTVYGSDYGPVSVNGSASGADSFTLMGFDISADSALTPLSISAISPNAVPSMDALISLRNVPQATIAHNTFHDASVGVWSRTDGSGSYNLDVYKNQFENLGQGTILENYAPHSMLNFHNNTVRRTGVGVTAVGIGDVATLEAYIHNNIFVGGRHAYGADMMLPLIGSLDVGGSVEAPSISAVMSLGYDGARSFSVIEDNLILGQVIGVTGVAEGQDTEVLVAVVNNIIRDGLGGGEILPVLPSMLGSIMPTVSLTPVAPEADMGLAGVMMFAANEAAMQTYVEGNRIADTLLGVTSLAVDGAYARVVIIENQLVGNMLGINGVAIADSYIDMLIFGNLIVGGGTEILGEFSSTSVPDTGLGGITFLAMDDGYVEADIYQNILRDHLFGISGVSIRGSMMGIYAEENSISGKGTEFVLSMMGLIGPASEPAAVSVNSLGPTYATRDEGISGITGVALDGGLLYMIAENNSIRNSALGVTLIADNSILLGAVVGNSIYDATVGVGALAMNGTDMDLYIIDNYINGNNVQPTALSGFLLENLLDPLVAGSTPEPKSTKSFSTHALAPEPIVLDTPIGILAISDGADLVYADIVANVLVGNAEGIVVLGNDNIYGMNVWIEDNVSDADFWSAGNSIDTYFGSNT